MNCLEAIRFVKIVFLFVVTIGCCPTDPEFGTEEVERNDDNEAIHEVGFDPRTEIYLLLNDEPVSELYLEKDGEIVSRIVCSIGDCLWGGGINLQIQYCTFYTDNMDFWGNQHGLVDGETFTEDGIVVSCEEKWRPDGESEGECFDDSYEGTYKIVGVKSSGEEISVKNGVWMMDNSQGCDFYRGSIDRPGLLAAML